MGSDAHRTLAFAVMLALLTVACGDLEDGAIENALAGGGDPFEPNTDDSDTAGSKTTSSPCEVGVPAAAYLVVPAGSFTMGSPTGEDGHDSDELQHRVTLTRSFALKATEVTQAEWQSAMGNTPSHFSGCDACPVESVNWWDALAYCNVLSGTAGLEKCYAFEGCSRSAEGNLSCASVTFAGLDCTGYRLPTEAEWEYAYRAGTSTAWYVGDEEEDVRAIGWFETNGTQWVAQKCPNAWGVYDMAGNVWEWCWDWYGDYPSESVRDPMGADEGSHRVFRGGGWFSAPAGLRAAPRNGGGSTDRFDYLGFRPARTVCTDCGLRGTGASARETANAL